MLNQALAITEGKQPIQLSQLDLLKRIAEAESQDQKSGKTQPSRPISKTVRKWKSGDPLAQTTGVKKDVKQLSVKTPYGTTTRKLDKAEQAQYAKLDGEGRRAFLERIQQEAIEVAKSRGLKPKEGRETATRAYEYEAPRTTEGELTKILRSVETVLSPSGANIGRGIAQRGIEAARNVIPGDTLPEQFIAGMAENTLYPGASFVEATGNLYDPTATIEERLGAAGNVGLYGLGAVSGVSGARQGIRAGRAAGLTGRALAKEALRGAIREGVIGGRSLVGDFPEPMFDISPATVRGAGNTLTNPYRNSEQAKTLPVEEPKVLPRPEAISTNEMVFAEPASPKSTAISNQPLVEDIAAMERRTQRASTFYNDLLDEIANQKRSVRPKTRLFRDLDIFEKEVKRAQAKGEIHPAVADMLDEYDRQMGLAPTTPTRPAFNRTEPTVLPSPTAPVETPSPNLVSPVNDITRQIDEAISPRQTVEQATPSVPVNETPVQELPTPTAPTTPDLPTVPTQAVQPDLPPVNLTAPANRFVDEVRAQFDLPSRQKPSRQKMTEWAEEAQAVDVDALISRIRSADRPTASAPEQVALGVRLSALQDELDGLNDTYRNAVRTGVVPDQLLDQIDSARNRLLQTIEASESVGTEAARTMNARKLLVRSDYSTAGLIKRQIKANPKSTPEDFARMEEYSRRIQELEARLEEANKLSPDTPTAKAKRAERKTKLQLEADDIINRLRALSGKQTTTPVMRNRQGGALNVGKTPEYVSLYGELAVNYIKRGYLSLDDVVRDVIETASSFGHTITRQQVIDAADDFMLKQAEKRTAKALGKDIQARQALRREIQKGSTRSQEVAARKAEERAAQAAGRQEELRVKREAAAEKRKLEQDAARARREAEQAAKKAQAATKQEEIRKYRAEEAAKKAEEREIMRNIRAVGGTAKQQAAKARQQKVKEIRETFATEKREAIKKYRAEEAAKRQEERDILKNIRESGGSAKEQAAKERRAKRDEYNQVFGQLALDDAAIARLQDAKGRLEAAIRTGDYSNYGKKRPPRQVTDLTKERELLEYQVNQLRRRIDADIASQEKGKFQKGVEGAFQLLRGLKLSLDMGAIARQGYDVFWQNPRAWAKGIKEGKQSMSVAQANRINTQLLNSEIGIAARRNGLELDDVFAHADEAGFGNVVGKLPGFSQLERFHVATQNQYRLGLYEAAVKANPNMTKDELKSLTSFINAMTGRSTLIKPGGLSQVFLTAPRMYVGQAEMMTAWLNPKYSPLSPKSPRAVKKMVVRRTLARLGVLVAAKAIAEEYGWEMSLNPEDRDFLKLRQGDTVIEIAGGYTPYYRYFTRILNALGSEKGRFKEMGRATMSEFQKKLSPLLSTSINIIAGEDYVGDPVFVDESGNRTLMDAGSWIKTLFPIILDEVYGMSTGKKFEDASVQGKVGAAGLSFVGVGVQSYPKESPKGGTTPAVTRVEEGADNLRQFIRSRLP